MAQLCMPKHSTGFHGAAPCSSQRRRIVVTAYLSHKDYGTVHKVGVSGSEDSFTVCQPKVAHRDSWATLGQDKQHH